MGAAETLALFDVRALPPAVREQLVEHVSAVYRWIDRHVEATAATSDLSCQMCGRCCDFDAYDHRLFVTTPEIVYFLSCVDAQDLRIMSDGICPYRAEARCSVYEHRFAGCRIFCCCGPLDVSHQTVLSEQALRCFKVMARRYSIPYVYTDLKTALGALSRAGTS